MTAAIAIVIFVIAYALIATEKVNRTVAALGGAGLMLALGITDAAGAFYDRETAVDWDVVFLLLGMMAIVGVLKQTGVFEYLAIASAKRAKGKPFRIMVTLIVITAVLSALLDNVTTVLLIAPVTVLVAERLGITPVPFLLAEAMASNIGGTATLIGDPPNIIIASRSGLGFNDFISVLAPFVVIALVVFIVMCRFMFGRSLRYDPDRAAEVMALNEKEAITDKALLVKSGVVLLAVMIAFAANPVIGLEPSVVALLGAGLLMLLSRLPVTTALSEVEWPTLAFFAGLFIMIGGLVRVGVIEELSRLAADVAGTDPFGASVLLLGVSAVLSALVDNIPYVATMSPVVADLTQAVGGGQKSRALWWALALGADLGGNATAIGASANVVVMAVSERNRYPISFWHFTKYGLMVAAMTVILAVPYLYLRLFAFS